MYVEGLEAVDQDGWNSYQIMKNPSRSVGISFVICFRPKETYEESITKGQSPSMPPKKASETGFVGFWYDVYIFMCWKYFPKKFRISSPLFFVCWQSIEYDRGGKGKCPVTLADLILMNNYLMEAIAKFDSEINDDYDLWASLSTLKDGFFEVLQSIR